jgi:hypothetical protein
MQNLADTQEMLYSLFGSDVNVEPGSDVDVDSDRDESRDQLVPSHVRRRF